MDNPGENLVVRQHERIECTLPASVRVGESHSKAVRISSGATDAQGGVRATVRDCSLGGVGLNSNVFLPKGTLITAAADFGPAGTLRVQLRVKRVVMLDRKPTYYIGAALAGPDDPACRKELERFIDAVRAQARMTSGAAGGPTNA